MPRPNNYIEREALAALVRQHKETGRISNELATALMLIAGGVWDRYHFTDNREDFVQEVTLHLIQNPIKKADAQQHLFNYFTTCAIRFGGKLREKAYGDRRRFQTYAEECLEAGRAIPNKRDHCDLTEIRTGEDDEILFTRKRAGRFTRRG